MWIRKFNNLLKIQKPLLQTTNLYSFSSEFVKKLRERTDFSEPQIPYDEYKGLQSMQKSIKEYIQQGELKDALEVSQIYSEKIQKFYGDTHPAYFSAINNIGLIYKMTGQYTQALEMYEFVHTGYSELFGANHNSTLTIRLNQANLYIQQGAYQNALEILKTVLSLRIGEHFQEIMNSEEEVEVKYDDIHLDNIEYIENNNIPLCLIPMSNCYRELKDYDKSIEMSKKALNLLYTKYAEDNILTATVYNNMGLTYKRAKEFTQAEEKYKVALEIRSKFLAPDHPDVLSSRHNLGELYLAMGEDEKGQEYLNENLRQMKPQN